MGIDPKAIEEQVREKQEKERQDKERDRYYEDLSKQHARTLSQLEAERAKQTRAEAEELEFFRKHQAQERKVKQTFEEQYKAQGIDPNSKILSFAGEDKEFSTRTRQQKLQQQDWLAQQISILRDRETRERRENVEYDHTQKQITELLKQQEELGSQLRKEEQRQVAEQNRLLASVKKQREHLDVQHNQKADEAEIQSALGSEFLNEVVGPRVTDARRPIPYHFKGFNSSQIQRIFDEQRVQQEESKRKRDEEQRREADYAAQQEAIRRQIVLAERERESQRKAQLKQLHEEHMAQKRDKEIRDQQTAQAYANQISESYFSPFGRSCR